MNFGVALELMKDGFSVRRDCWDTFVVVRYRYAEGLQRVVMKRLEAWRPTLEELMANDWKLVL